MKQIKADQSLAIAAIAVLVPLGLVSSSQPSTSALVWVLASAAILFRSTLCLLLMLTSLFVGYYIFSRTSAEDLGFVDLILAVLTISFVSLALRYIGMSNQSMASSFWTKLSDQDTPRPLPDFQKQNFRPWAGFIFSISISIVVALILFAVLPLSRFRGTPYGLVPPILRMITILWILGLGGFAAQTFFALIKNRKMSRQQAQLVTLRTIDEELGREQTAIEQRVSQ